MSEPLFEDLPILGELGASLREAMVRAEQAAASPVAARRGRRARFRWLGSFLVLGLVGTTAAAGTLTLLRGSPIPGPRPRTRSRRWCRAPIRCGCSTCARAIPTAGSCRTRCASASPKRARPARPSGRSTAETSGSSARTGASDRCRPGSSTAAATPPRTMSPLPARGCSTRDAGATCARSSMGPAGRDLESAAVVSRGVARPVAVHDGGFVAVVRGYPEDQGLQIRMRVGGRTVVRDFGGGPMLVLDPEGPAWQLSMGTTQTHGKQYECVQLTAARRRTPMSSYSTTPTLCAGFPPPPPRVLGRPKQPWFFDVRTLHPGDGARPKRLRLFSVWRWSRPSRTVIWATQTPARCAVSWSRRPASRRASRSARARGSAPCSRPRCGLAACASPSCCATARAAPNVIPFCLWEARHEPASHRPPPTGRRRRLRWRWRRARRRGRDSERAQHAARRTVRTAHRPGAPCPAAPARPRPRDREFPLPARPPRHGPARGARPRPAGGAEWAVRVFEADRMIPPPSRRPGSDGVASVGLCAQLGRIVGGRFGWIDGRGAFRVVTTAAYTGTPATCVSRKLGERHEPRSNGRPCSISTRRRPRRYAARCCGASPAERRGAFASPHVDATSRADRPGRTARTSRSSVPTSSRRTPWRASGTPEARRAPPTAATGRSSRSRRGATPREG